MTSQYDLSMGRIGSCK